MLLEAGRPAAALFLGPHHRLPPRDWLAALIALLVGLIMTLATLIGPGFATAAVVIGVLTIAAVLALIGRGKLAPPNTGAPR